MGGVAGDRSGFAEFAAVSGPRLLRFAMLLCGDRAQAQDLVQEALARVYVRWVRLGPDQPEAYARRIVVNLQNSWWRSPWFTRRDRVVPERAAADAYASVDDKEMVLAALRDLPPRMRAVVVMRHWAGLSERETADQLGMSLGSVKSQSSRGLAQLRRRLSAPASAPASEGASHD